MQSVFSPLLEAICARLTQETAQRCTSLQDSGIGLPHHISQMIIRVESSVLHGSEVLASTAEGCVAKFLSKSSANLVCRALLW